MGVVVKAKFSVEKSKDADENTQKAKEKKRVRKIGVFHGKPPTQFFRSFFHFSKENTK